MSDTQPVGGTSVTLDGFVIESSSIMPGAQASVEELTARAKSALDGIPAEELEPPDPDPGDVTPPAKADVQSDATPADAKAGDDKPEDKDRGQKRLDSIQARIHAATRERHQAEQAAREAKAELERVRAEAAAAATPKKAADAAALVVADIPADDLEPQWEGADGYDHQNKSYAEFQKDHTAWVRRQTARDIAATLAARDAQTADQRTAAQREAEDARFFEAMDRRHQDRVQARLASDAAFAEAIKSDEFTQMPTTPFIKSLVKLHDKGLDVLAHIAQHPAEGYAFVDLDLTTPMMDAFKASDDPVRLLRALANNPQEAQRIARLSSAAQMRALVLLEIQADGAKPGSPSPVASTPASPPLPARVGGTRSVAARKDPMEMTTDDAAAYVREMNARDRAAS